MIGSKELPVAYSLPSRNSSRGLRKIGLEVFLGERFWAFRDDGLRAFSKMLSSSNVPKPLRLPQNLLQEFWSIDVPQKWRLP